MKPLKNKGFTLVEIIIVLVIIGLVAAIVIPSLTNYTTDTNESACQSARETMLKSYEAYIEQAIYESESGGSETFESWLQYEGERQHLTCPAGGIYSYEKDSVTGEERIVCSIHGRETPVVSDEG